jgi:hypothetical protein
LICFYAEQNLQTCFDLVAHKAFPKAQLVKDLVIELGTPPPRYNQPPPAPFDVYNWNSYNDNRLLTNVKNYMKGNFLVVYVNIILLNQTK